MRLVVVVALAGCGFSARVDSKAGDASVDGLTDAALDALPIDGAPGSARKRRITIPDAKIFGNVDNFPVWLVIDDATGLGAKATAAGNDIYFTRTDGVPLEFERVAWSKANGHLEAWVRVSLVDGMANEFDLRFGDPGPAHAPNAAMTWSNGFVAVWHMDDTLGGNTTVADAKGAVMGTATNGPVAVTGKLRGAFDLDGMNDEVTFTNPITGGGSTTISAWVALANPTAGFSSLMTLGTNAANQSRFFHTKYSGLAVGFFGNDIMTTLDIHNSQFTLLHWVYDGVAKTSSLYRDGVQVGTSVTINGTINTQGTGGHIGTAPMPWGPGGNTTSPVNGLLDEVRIASAPRSLAWIRTEHANQDDVGTFFMLGDDVPAQ